MRSSASYHAGGEFNQPHFLDSCSLCRKHLSQNSDIYMYRQGSEFSIWGKIGSDFLFSFFNFYRRICLFIRFCSNFCRGNAPFCSQECRQEQIEMDEANEKRWKISSKRSGAVRQQSKDSSKESDTNKAVRTGTVAVA